MVDSVQPNKEAALRFFPALLANLSTVYPPELKLTQVQFIHRHGHRSPLSNPFLNLEFTVNGRGFCSVSEGNGLCNRGQLTDKGKQLMQMVGSRLRTLYSDRLHFLPSMLTDDPSKTLRYKSTEIQRAIDSAVSVLSGLYPRPLRSKPDETIEIFTRKAKNEYFYPNYQACPALSEFFFGSLNRTIMLAQKPVFEAIEKRLLEQLPLRPNRKPMSPQIWYDVLTCAREHDVPLPPVVDDQMMQALGQLSVDLWWTPYTKYPEMIRLGVGLLLQELVDHIQNFEPSNSPPLLLFSGHDSTLAPIMAGLGTYNDTWPEFGAHLILERFERQKDEVFVRVLHNFKPQKIPQCQDAASAAGVAAEFCPLTQFVKILEPFFVKDYEKECHVVK